VNGRLYCEPAPWYWNTCDRGNGLADCMNACIGSVPVSEFCVDQYPYNLFRSRAEAYQFFLNQFNKAKSDFKRIMISEGESIIYAPYVNSVDGNLGMKPVGWGSDASIVGFSRSYLDGMVIGHYVQVGPSLATMEL